MSHGLDPQAEMNLAVLSSSECMSLCRDAAFLVMSRFRWLAQRTAPEDRPLILLFRDLAADLEANLQHIEHLEGLNPSSGDGETGQRTARGFLPSLEKTPGGSGLDRESGFYLAECILKDLDAFYGALVRHICDEQSRTLLQRSKQAVENRLKFLRHVVL
jgi:hypothetical protein